MKKSLLTAGVLALLTVSAFGQRVAKPNVLTKQTVPAQRNCGTQLPCQEWEDWLTAKVEEFKNNQETGKMASMPTYTIPVIVHVIHNGTAVGSGYNLSQTQVNSQITVLNNDFAGTGFNVGNVPSVFASLVSNTQISFCMAQKDPNGNILAEPGIDRINRNSKGWSAPPYTSTYVDGTIKPNSIWDPSQYLNIWVCDLSGGLLGYATFPANSSLTCLSAPFGSATTDGVVILYNAFGNTGNVSAPYNKGRTTTHEVGHWLGLRHIWGDSNCGSDCVSDTPPAQTSNFSCPTHPYNAGGCSGNTNGEMFMNFMDYTDDACMYMFTPGQTTRMQTCMANGTYRSGLSNASITVCNSTPVAPVAGFSFPAGTLCSGSAIAFTNTSTNSPTSYAWSVSPSSGVTINTATSTNPTITFANTGTYSVTLTATNAQGSDSEVQTLVVQSCVGGCDTLSNFDFSTDTPALYGSGGFGYASGHNDYLDKAKADYFAATYPAGYTIKEAYYFFAKGHDGGTASNITCKVWDDNGASGAPSSALTPSVVLPITQIDITNGNQVIFNPPVNPNSGAFYIGFDGLTYNGTTATFDTVAIMTNSDGESTPVTAWEQWSDNSWHSFNDGTGATWQLDISLAIAVVLCDPTTGVPYIMNPTHEVIVYPNPANNTVYVNANFKNEGKVTIKLMNVMGQTLGTKVIENTTSGTFDFDLGSYSSGVYFINVSTPEKTITKKFVIEK